MYFAALAADDVIQSARTEDVYRVCSHSSGTSGSHFAPQWDFDTYADFISQQYQPM
jgi:hypothetical protein